MNNTGQKDSEAVQIQSLLGHYLASRGTLRSSVGETSIHFDEDSLSTFVEGSISEREAMPMVRHLVDCGFCRHRTAELVALEAELAESDEIPVAHTATEGEPSKISQVLEGIISKIFGTTDKAVFAHQENDEDEDKKNENN